MTDMTTILTCDECGLHYRASLLPHKCADWTKGHEQPRPEQAGGETTSETVPCELCSALTRMKSTKRCDRCWELEHRIQDSPELARKILAAIEHDAPAAPERGEQWRVVPEPVAPVVAEIRAGDVIIVGAVSTEIAEQIVREHNQHSTLIAQRERLIEGLRLATKIKTYGEPDNLEARNAAMKVLTTIEQEGTRER